ncbi:MAG: hypothetical protein ACWGQW_00600 [bacterium]
MVVQTLPDRATLIANLLRIDNKEGIVVPFIFNHGQLHFNRNKRKRNIILKHRQGGWSSSILADMFMDCLLRENIECAVVSHEGRATQRLLDRVQFYYDHMDDPKPPMGAESRVEKTFPENNTSIYVGTAGSRAFGRGDTIQKALLSELAFYENGDMLLNAIEDSVPLSGELTIECTPNGEGNIFYDTWVRAREGRNPYTPFFFPWWWTDEYRIPLGSMDALPEDRGVLHLTEEELELVRLNGLTEEQIRWRRWKIAEKQGMFWQEYPEDEVSCWITIGDPAFDQSILNRFASMCAEPEHHPDGWNFWIPPQEGVRYKIGVDTSSGAPEGSYSAACCVDDFWQVPATFQARMEPHQLASLLKKMGHWYNDAELIIERNFTGYAVLEQLSDYSNIAHQMDFTTGRITNQKGWWSNSQTRDLMMSIAKEKLGEVKMWDANLVRQLRSYRYIKLKKKYREEAQTFDDLAIAFMLAVAARKTVGTARGYQGKVPGWSW